MCVYFFLIKFICLFKLNQTVVNIHGTKLFFFNTVHILYCMHTVQYKLQFNAIQLLCHTHLLTIQCIINHVHLDMFIFHVLCVCIYIYNT